MLFCVPGTRGNTAFGQLAGVGIESKNQNRKQVGIKFNKERIFSALIEIFCVVQAVARSFYSPVPGQASSVRVHSAHRTEVVSTKFRLLISSHRDSFSVSHPFSAGMRDIGIKSGGGSMMLQNCMSGARQAQQADGQNCESNRRMIDYLQAGPASVGHWWDGGRISRMALASCHKSAVHFASCVYTCCLLTLLDGWHGMAHHIIE